jgi:hypothetical protein
MLKDLRNMVANWLVKLLGFAPGSAVAQGGVMSIGCGLKGNCGGGFIIKAIGFRLDVGVEM